MFGMLIAYDADGNVVATLDYLVMYDEDTDEPLGLVDFIAHEKAGGKFRHRVEGDTLVGIWDNDQAVGSAAWPEWIGARAHDFKVELDGQKRIAGLVHKKSGHRRDRAAIEQAISDRIASATGQPADIRDLVGGPNKHMRLDDNGRNAPPTKKLKRADIALVPRVAPAHSSTDAPPPGFRPPVIAKPSKEV